MKKKFGRPPKYGKQILAKSYEYLNKFVDYDDKPASITTEEEVNDFAAGKLELFPSVVGLALYLGVSRSTVYAWKDAHDDFSDIVDTCNTLQEFRLIHGGARGLLNSTITKLHAASAIHFQSGWQHVTQVCECDY